MDLSRVPVDQPVLFTDARDPTRSFRACRGISRSEGGGVSLRPEDMGRREIPRQARNDEQWADVAPIMKTGPGRLPDPVSRRSACLPGAPIHELAERREVVVGPRCVADEVCDPFGQILIELVELRAEDLRGPLHLIRVAADFGAPLVEDAVLAPEHVRLPLAVPDGGVL